MNGKNDKKIDPKNGCDHHSQLDSVYIRWEYGRANYCALWHCATCGSYDEHRIDIDDYLYWQNRGYGHCPDRRKIMNEKKDRYDVNSPASYIFEALEWMQAEKARNSQVRMRQSDWQWLIVRMEKALYLLEREDQPEDDN